MSWPPDIPPMTTSQRITTVLILIITSILANLFYPNIILTIIAGLIAYLCVWVFVCDLFNIFSNPPATWWTEKRKKDREKLAKLPAILVISLPIIVIISAIIFAITHSS